MTEGIVNIHGKEYQTVAYRVQKLREAHPDWSIQTHLVARDDASVVMMASIMDDKDRVLGTGYAEEFRASSHINKTSALENAETSAIGRALAAAGYGGTEYASANEVQTAIQTQGIPPEDVLRACASLAELQQEWLKLSAADKKRLASVKDEVKEELEGNV